MIDLCTRRRFLLVLLTTPIFSAGATEPHRDVVDYFLMLPPDRLEAPPSAWLDLMRHGGGHNIIDKENGYLRCEGDGAQPAFEVALFRYRDGSPLLAVCQGGLEDANSLYLEFYVPGPKGRLQQAPRSLFPVGEEANSQFILPQKGRTITVRDRAGRHHPAKHERRFVWNGEHFVEEK